MAEIRHAVMEDIPGLLLIYNEIIANSTAVYQDEPLSLDNRQAWFAARQQAGFPVLVAMDAGRVVGFSSFGEYRAFHGYRFTVEHSVHIAPDYRGRGLGGALLAGLLPLATSLGKHAMLGVIDADNAASIALHAKHGFVQVAHMPQVGFKFGRWLDAVFMQRLL
ncbi:MAG: GNAT family N-acetyltransferase [Hyphomicrobiales bacterium]|nr:GNAT family N-acetyltransferase [Hyphomicrobiales bacterium]MDE2115860.1 N-acetyltransferase [Hyphomicrobiales bacterium]